MRLKLPQPQFEIGDTVFVASLKNLSTFIECPNCLGSKQWSVTCPNGDTFKTGCKTCDKGWNNSDGRVAVFTIEPRGERMTVGSIRVDTNAEDTISYMMEETGVGSGTVYYAKKVFATEQEAIAEAVGLASDQEQKVFREQQKRTEERGRTGLIYPDNKNASLEQEGERLRMKISELNQKIANLKCENQKLFQKTEGKPS